MSPDLSVTAASEVASLLASLLDEPIVIADVGCRWGFADTWEQLGDRCRAIGFEPDDDECERLRNHYHDRPWVEIVANALGREAGTATLHITSDPACSSLYSPLDDVVDRHPRLEMQRLADRQHIELITLDEWCERRGLDRIDLVKLDTQGSELDVLRGATRILERVLVVQTEVEFNRMYEGQPLFGDIDRFLRDRGFVLWHLENLSHHRQRGARSTLRLGTEFFDWDVVQFSRRPGQLFWADALFVRTDVARPRPGTEWREAVRHACLAAALGLDDLAGLALDLHHRNLEGEARERVEAARWLLPEPDHETSWATAIVGFTPREGPQPMELSTHGVLDDELVVDLGAPIEGAGWREPHRLGSKLGRWTGPGRHAWIDVPLKLLPRTRVEVVIAEVSDGDAYGTITIDVNGVPIDLERTAYDSGFMLSGSTPDVYGSERTFTRVSIQTPEPVPRHGAADPRKIGVGITELRLRPPLIESESPIRE
jgi:FkbM family methyltransferase